MSKILAVGIVELSDKAIMALKWNGINSLQELMMQYDLGLLNEKLYGTECFQELQNACKKIDRFYECLNRELIIQTGKMIKSDPALNRPTSLKSAIIELLDNSPNEVFDRKTMQKILRRRYGSTISTNTDTIRSTLSSLVCHGIIKRIDSDHYTSIHATYACNQAASKFVKNEALDVFLFNHMGKEIEFRYKTERPRSENKWRHVTIQGQDIKCFTTTERFPSGRPVRYLKERVVEYREVPTGR
jgi:Fe2+ or Zn2+ uptake regulation protein